MDAKDPFSHDSVNTIPGIGREWALSCRHDPPHIRKYKNREREKGQRSPDGGPEPPPESEKGRVTTKIRDGTEGFEITI
jgi:hypothetical protein